MVNEEFEENTLTGFEEPAEEKPVLTPEQKKAKSAKLMTVITYSIALLCLLAGLFVPLYSVKAFKPLDRMYFKYVPAIFNALLFPFVKKSVINLPADGFFVPLLAEPDKFSSTALAQVVYAIVCVVGLIMLIPVLAGKNTKRTSAVCAYVVELLAVLSTGWLIFFQLQNFVWGYEWPLYNFVIAFGGALLMMFIQSVYNKGGLGVSKIILLVLSALIFMFLLNLYAFIPAVGKAFNSLSNALGCGEAAVFSKGTLFIYGIYGTHFIDFLKSDNEIFAALTSSLTSRIFYIVGGVFVCLCLFNFAYDAFEIVTGSKYDKQGLINKNKAMSVIAITRYALALVLAIVCIVLLLVVKDMGVGLYLYIITAIIFLQLLTAIIRAAVLSSKRKKAEKADEIAVKEDTAPVFHEDFSLNENSYEDNDEDTIRIETPVYQEEYVYTRRQQQQQSYQQPAYAEPQYEEPQYQQPLYEDEPAEDEPDDDEQQRPYYYEPQYEHSDYGRNDNNDKDEPVKTEERTYVYNYKAVYNGPTDEFMNTLTDAEKIEFVQVFIEKRKGKIKGVPDYNIGEENKNFFHAVFVHINRSRELASTGLLEKIYKHICKN